MSKRLPNALVLGSIAIDPKSLSLAGDQPTSRIQICKTGSWPHSTKRPGGFSITPTMLEQMQKNASQELPVDYNHLSIGAMLPDQAIAAGWMNTPLILENDGKELYADTRWTPKAAQHIQAGEYRYISPTFLPDAIDPATGDKIGAKLMCVALTNLPFLQGMAPVELSELERFGMVHLVDGSLSIEDKQARVYEAVYEKFRNDSEYARPHEIFDDHVIIKRGTRYFKLTYALDDNGKVTFGEGLQEVLPQGYAEIAATSLKIGAVTMPENTPDAATLVSLQAQLTSLQGIVTGLQTEAQAKDTKIMELSQQLVRTSITASVDALVRDKKLAPAQKEHYIELGIANKDLFEKITATLTPIVPSAEVGSGNDGKKTGDAAKSEEIMLEADADKVINLVSEKVTAFKKENPTLGFSEAMQAVFEADPQLGEKYRAAFVVSGTPGHAN